MLLTLVLSVLAISYQVAKSIPGALQVGKDLSLGLSACIGATQGLMIGLIIPYLAGKVTWQKHAFTTVSSLIMTCVFPVVVIIYLDTGCLGRWAPFWKTCRVNSQVFQSRVIHNMQASHPDLGTPGQGGDLSVRKRSVPKPLAFAFSLRLRSKTLSLRSKTHVLGRGPKKRLRFGALRGGAQGVHISFFVRSLSCAITGFPWVIDLLMGLFRGAVFHGGGVPENSPLALTGLSPSLMGRFLTLMGRFFPEYLNGLFSLSKIPWKQPIKKRPMKRFYGSPSGPIKNRVLSLCC